MLVKLLRKYLGKKYIISLPEPLIKIMFGQMGEELLLSSQNIKPMKLKSLGFTFEDTQMQNALQRYL
jgi:NAD dependent epimerase/dehydratase family enzyme